MADLPLADRLEAWDRILGSKNHVSAHAHGHWQDVKAELRSLQAENERHQKANLVRAVLKGYGDVEEWISECINDANFDAVPWKVAENLRKRLAATEAIAKRLFNVVSFGDDAQWWNERWRESMSEAEREILDRLNEASDGSESES